MFYAATPAGPSNMVDEPKEPARTRPPRRAAERRTEPRYRFTATAELFEEKSGTRAEARIADISQQGCYVETGCAFCLGTAIRVSISKEPKRFVTQARVVYSSAKGMGLVFCEITPGQIHILETWLGPLREKDLLTLSRRKTQRVLMRVPIRVSGHNMLASQFDEQTHTLAVNAHEASILPSTSVKNGQWLKLVNVTTGDKVECIVAYVGRRQADRVEVGVSFILANPRFWHVVFPPHDRTPL
jgi:PilZ domain